MAVKGKIDPALTYLPQEEVLDIGRKEAKLYIGIPKESNYNEARVALTPEAVNVLINNGHRVAIERHAGDGAHFYDEEYSEAGAKIVTDKKSLYKSADIIVKSAPVHEEEIAYFRPGQTLISSLGMPSLTTDRLQKMMEKGVTALSFESLKDDAGSYPIVRSMSEIAGSASMLIAGQYLGNAGDGKGKGVLLGGISGVPPTKVVIIGAGMVGEYAARTALAMGSSVKVFDNDIYKLKRLQNHIGLRLYTSVINPHILADQLRDTDVAIGAIAAPSGRTPVVVTEEMVGNMPPGSIIVDVSIDRGGCFETSEPTSQKSPIYKKYGIIHYCVPNIPSAFARTASRAISNVLMPLLIQAADEGGFDEEIWKKQGVREGIYLYKGALTSEYLSQRFHLKYTDFELLRAAKS